MIPTQLPIIAYQLAAQYDLGEPIRLYRTDKRPQFKILGWVLAILYSFIIIIVLAQTHFQIPSKELPIYGILLAIMVFIALLFFFSLLIVRKATIYICTSGFILHRKATFQAIRWQEVEHVSSGNERLTIHLTNKKYLKLGNCIADIEMLAQEIEIKSNLVNSLHAGHLEQQFASIRDSRAARQQEKTRLATEKQALIENEQPDEASKLQEEYRMGEILGTYHAGFKGFMRHKAIAKPIFYVLLLAFGLTFISSFVHFPFLFGQESLIFTALYILGAIFMPRYSAHYTRLHLYATGCIYIENDLFEVVHWGNVEKIVYSKTLPVLSPPFCQLYLPNGDKIALSGYVHAQDAIKKTINDHVAYNVQII